MYYLSPHAYSLKGLLQNEIYGLDFHCASGDGLLPYPSDPRANVPPPLGFGGRLTCPLRSSHDVLALYDMDASDSTSKWWQLLWVWLFLLAFNVLASLTALYVDWSSGDTSDPPSWREDVRTKSVSTQQEGAQQSVHAPSHTRNDESRRSQESASASASASASTAHPGEVRLHFLSDGALAPAHVCLAWSNLSYWISAPRDHCHTNKPACDTCRSGSKQLLTSCFGKAQTGILTALMGESGAGHAPKANNHLCAPSLVSVPAPHLPFLRGCLMLCVF